MKVYGIIMILILSSIYHAHAQEYKSAYIYEAHGNVKEIRTESKNPLNKNKLKFLPNGKQKTEIMTFNKDGYPVGYGMNMGSTYNNLDIEYDSLCNVSAIISNNNIIGNNSIKIENIYDGKRLSRRITYISSKGKSGHYVSVFTNEKYDSEGNWISRDVEDTIYDSDGIEIKKNRYTETRKITYY